MSWDNLRKVLVAWCAAALVLIGAMTLLFGLLDAFSPEAPVSSGTGVTNITSAGHVYEHSKDCPCQWDVNSYVAAPGAAP